MKKRLLSALLALALVFVLLPTTALAGEVATKGDISIAGKGWNFTKSTSGYETVYYQVQSNNGVFSTSLENKTDCVYPTNPYLEITRNGNTITVIVHREVTITTNKGTNKAAEECIEVNKSDNQTTTLNLVIKGAEGTTNNTLTLECKGYGSALSSYQGDITITGGVTVNAKSTYTNSSTGVSARAINVFNGDLTISGTGTTVNAENKDRNYPTIDVKNAVTISDGATLTAKNTNGGKAISCRSITADGYDFMGRSGNSGSYTTLTGDDKATRLQEYSSIQITPTPTPALEKSNVYVAGTNLYKNTAYTIQNGKPVMGGTYPGNYNIYFDATDYVLHVKGANIDARGTSGIYGTSNIVFEGKNSITASSYGIYSYFKSSDLKISGSGSLMIKTIAACPAIATDYNTSRSIIISGNDFTVTADTSGTTSYAIKSDKDLTITGGAAVTAKSNATRAIDIKGDLTVTNGSLTATSTSDSVPTVQVGGNASFTGSTVTITNNSTALHKDAADKIKGDSVSSALYVKGDINITDNAKVTAKVENGGGNAIGALGNITVNGSTVTAVNKGQKFTTIIAKNVYVSGDSKITANNLNENPVYNGSYLAFPAIEGKIANQNTDYSLKFEGQHSRTSVPKTTLAPGEQTTLYYYNVTITRGDEVTRTNSPVVIDGHTLLNDTYYTINGSTVAEGTEDNYNAFYDSETKTLKLNNAQISHSFAHEYGDGTDGAIIFKEYKNYCIELSGTNTISSMNTYAINGDTNSLTIKNADGAENAKLTLTGNWTAICSTEGLNIQSDVTMVNTKRADHLMYVNGTFSFDGYNAYASVNASGSPLVEYTVPTSGDKDAGYQYLRITKETLETGGGSTHQHTYDQSAWKSDATHHWQECTDPNCPDPTKGITNKAPHSFSNGACTVCGYRGQTEEHHFSTDWTYDETHHWHACTDDGCTAIKDKAPHEWTGWRIDEPSPGMHNRFCNCGYNDYSHHYNLVYAAAGEAGHYQYCTLGNCTFKTSTVPHNYDGDTCTICNYTKSGEIVPPTPDNPGTIVIIRPAEEEKPAQQPNPSTGANDLVGLAVAAAVAAALGSAALLRKHD